MHTFPLPWQSPPPPHVFFHGGLSPWVKGSCPLNCCCQVLCHINRKAAKHRHRSRVPTAQSTAVSNSGTHLELSTSNLSCCLEACAPSTSPNTLITVGHSGLPSGEGRREFHAQPLVPLCLCWAYNCTHELRATGYSEAAMLVQECN